MRLYIYTLVRLVRAYVDEDLRETLPYVPPNPTPCSPPSLSSPRPFPLSPRLSGLLNRLRVPPFALEDRLRLETGHPKSSEGTPLCRRCYAGWSSTLGCRPPMADRFDHRATTHHPPTVEDVFPFPYRPEIAPVDFCEVSHVRQ